MEMLKGNNWMPWKRRMLAVLRDLSLETYIDKDSKLPTPKDPHKPTDAEKEAEKKWREGDAKARTRIELAIGDSEMIHIISATTASEMWKQLTLVKESRGKLGILATRRTLYRMIADEGFDLVEHISKLRKMQEELHLMGSMVSDEDFAMILVSSLPESWDLYTSAYLGSKADGTLLTSHELVAILLEEDRRRRERTGDPRDVAMQGRAPNRGGSRGKPGEHSERECYNCHKKGHLAKDCWAKGGGKEGQGPKGRKKSNGGNKNRANQATDTVNDALADVAYSANTRILSHYDWVLDSGTTSHICNQRKAFIEYTPLKDSPVQGLGSIPAQATGRGTVVANFTVKGNNIRHKLQDVLHIPEAPNSLLSVSRIDDSGGHTSFQNGKCELYSKANQLIGTGVKSGRLYILDARAQLQNNDRANLAAPQKLSWDQWHRRYGHLGMTGLETLKTKGLVNGLEVDESSVPSRTCEACIQAKQATRPFPKEAENRSTVPGERSLSDVWGPARVESIGGSKYYISFTDDAVRTCVALFMKTKDEATSRIKAYINVIEKKFGRTPKYLRFDNGKELVNKEIEKWAAEKGIVIETTAPYSPSQHGTAERFNRTLLELARAMLIEKKLPPFLWPEAVAHAAYIRNRSPTRALDGKTPHEAWTGKKPDVSHFREFGCDVWVLNQGEKGSKLAPKSRKMKFMGFLDGQKAIRYYDPTKRTIRVSRNVTFDENEEPRELQINTDLPGLQLEGEQVINGDLPNPKTAPTTAEQTKPDSEPQTKPEAEPESHTYPPRSSRRADIDYRTLNNPNARPARRIPHVPPDVTRPTESSSAKQKSHDAETNIAIAFLSGQQDSETDEEEPKSLDAAKKSSEWPQWHKAVLEELETLKTMGTWELEDLPEGREPIGNRWTFVKKRDENGDIARYKARLVAQGFTQKPGTDFSNTGTFAPVMRFETLRTLLAMSAIHNWELCQMDIKGAYLNGKIMEELYMKQPTGFEDGTAQVCRLRCKIYGL